MANYTTAGKRAFRRAFSAILAFFVADTDTDVNSFSTGFENLFWLKFGGRRYKNRKQETGYGGYSAAV